MAASCAQKEADTGFMNPDADPGTDFFEYANGGWNAAHPLTAEYSTYGVMDDIAENNRKQLRDLIEGLAAETHAPGSLEQKIGDLYKLAMDSTRRNAEGWAPIQGDLDAIQGAKDKAGLLRVIAQLSRKGVPTFFGVWVDADLKTASRTSSTSARAACRSANATTISKRTARRSAYARLTATTSSASSN